MPRRTRSGYRQYTEGVVDRIRFIRRAQNVGFTLDEIEDLLALRVDDPEACQAVERARRARLAAGRGHGILQFREPPGQRPGGRART